MSHTYVQHAALGICLMPSLIGLNSLLRPDATMASVKFPMPTEPSARKMTLTLLRLMAVRNFSTSFLIFLLWRNGDPKQLGLSLMAPIGMTIADGIISIMAIGGNEWAHWSFTPVLVGLAANLLGWVKF